MLRDRGHDAPMEKENQPTTVKVALSSHKPNTHSMATPRLELVLKVNLEKYEI